MDSEPSLLNRRADVLDDDCRAASETPARRILSVNHVWAEAQTLSGENDVMLLALVTFRVGGGAAG
jgi:hypothetical protein